MFRARGSFCHLTEGQMEGGREGGEEDHCWLKGGQGGVSGCASGSEAPSQEQRRGRVSG